MKPNFATIWDKEVRELAKACINEEVVNMLNRTNDKPLTEEEERKLEEWNNQYVDLLAMCYISSMCF